MPRLGACGGSGYEYPMELMLPHIRTLIAAVFLVSQIVGLRGGPVTTGHANSFPPASITWYVTNFYTGDNHWYNAGCNLGGAALHGQVGQSLVVIMDFGSEWLSGSTWGTDWIDRDGVWHTWTQAQAVIDSYADGFYVCTGSDTSAQLTIAAGIRNYGLQWSGQPAAATAGLAWAQLTNDFENSLGIYKSQVGVQGAIDNEPPWSSPAIAINWGNGFNGNGYAYYDYGSADGCPQSQPFGSCNAGWTQANEYTVSWGIAAAQPIPEIYNQAGAQAAQWQQISLWGYYYGTYHTILFPGELTQYNACQQVGGCSGVDNLPVQGWTQLYNALNADSRTADSNIPWSTDIRWG